MALLENLCLELQLEIKPGINVSSAVSHTYSAESVDMITSFYTLLCNMIFGSCFFLSTAAFIVVSCLRGETANTAHTQQPRAFTLTVYVVPNSCLFSHPAAT